MKKVFCIIAFLSINYQVFSQVPAIKFYLDDGSIKEYKIEDIRNLTYTNSNLSYSILVFQKGNIKNDIDIREIDSILFEENQIMKIFQSEDTKTFNVSNIDSIIFVSNAELPDTNNFQIEVTTTSSPQDFIVRFVNPGTLHVDWGDGKTNDYNTTVNATHSYTMAGVYTVKMSGYVNHIDFFISPDPGLGTPRLISAIKSPIRGITGLNSATEMFKHCENIPSIPAGLFDQCPEINSFYDTFLACKRIKSIPPGLFNAQTNVVNFYATFDNCDSLTSIPPGLFDKHINNTNFAWTFAKCYSLTNVPDGLFDANTKVTTFSYVFFRCYSLTTIPPHLFDKNTKVTDFSRAFEDCRMLSGESPTNLEGKKLWELSPTPNGTKCFSNCTNLSDYSTIPTGWK
ncbi:hypothetical protein D9V86_04135 [Bacteroidetes/Chlorobi group bacterium ChocPot_Mid]|nr:MAG: hypothetical protein D9V86_04135 [Bacteroidetes/Chlorobi group bacterium ChocPot_Mid]